MKGWRKLMEEEGSHAIWRRRHSKMSGERAATWSARTLKIRLTLRTLKSHKNTPAEFLYYIQIQCEYMRQDTLFMERSVLVGKMGEGRVRIREERPRVELLVNVTPRPSF